MLPKHRTIILIGVIALLASACGTGGGSRASGSPTQPSSSASTSTVGFQVWFGYGEFLFVTRRTQPATPAVRAASVTALLAGPSTVEQAAGVGTSIPEGTELLGLSIAGRIATVDLTRSFEAGGGSLSMFSRLAQLTYTLTQFPTVRSVSLSLDGRPVRVFSGEGIIIDQPMTRRSFSDRLPPILVRSLLIGQQVSSPIDVSGTADVFEATVSISILDAQGHELATTTTQATCGSGCRGSFSKAVPYAVTATQLGIVRVYEWSARNGKPIHVVSLPVILSGPENAGSVGRSAASTGSAD